MASEKTKEEERPISPPSYRLAISKAKSPVNEAAARRAPKVLDWCGVTCPICGNFVGRGSGVQELCGRSLTPVALRDDLGYRLKTHLEVTCARTIVGEVAVATLCNKTPI